MPKSFSELEQAKRYESNLAKRSRNKNIDFFSSLCVDRKENACGV